MKNYEKKARQLVCLVLLLAGVYAQAVTYLSDLTWVSAQTDYGTVQKDLSSEGNAITISGQIYPKGIGTHANSEIIYYLNAAYDTFISDIGIDQEIYAYINDPSSEGTVRFKVYLDGIEAYASVVTVNRDNGPQSVYVNVTGVNELKLVVEDAGDGNSCDHADWAGARLTTQRDFLIVTSYSLFAESQLLRSRLNEYRSDLQAQGWNAAFLYVSRVPVQYPVDGVAVTVIDGAHPQDQLKQAIHLALNNRNALQGFVLIGSEPDIPVVWYKNHTTDEYAHPTDLYYADADSWEPWLETGSYNKELDAYGDAYVLMNPADPWDVVLEADRGPFPELLYARISAHKISASLSGEADKVAAYLDKIHSYRQNGSSPLSLAELNTAFLYSDDSWVNTGDKTRDGAWALAKHIKAYNDLRVTNHLTLSRGFEQGSFFCSVFNHSSENSFAVDEWQNLASGQCALDTDAINQLNVKAHYIYLFSCGACRFTKPNLGETLLFNNNYVYNVCGKTLSENVPLDNYYMTDIRRGATIGQAIRTTAWYIKRVDKHAFHALPSHILLGDPLLTYFNQTGVERVLTDKAPVITNALVSLEAAVGEDFTLNFGIADEDEADEDAESNVSVTLEAVSDYNLNSASLLPDNSVFNAAERVFFWTPTVAQAGKAYTFRVKATDTQQNTFEEEFTVYVNNFKNAFFAEQNNDWIITGTASWIEHSNNFLKNCISLTDYTNIINNPSLTSQQKSGLAACYNTVNGDYRWLKDAITPAERTDILNSLRIAGYNNTHGLWDLNKRIKYFLNFENNSANLSQHIQVSSHTNYRLMFYFRNALVAGTTGGEVPVSIVIPQLGISHTLGSDEGRTGSFLATLYLKSGTYTELDVAVCLGSSTSPVSGDIAITSVKIIKEEPGRVFLSDLTPVSATSGWGSVQYDRSILGNLITIGGQRFEKGIGTHANSVIIYQLNGAYKFFGATIGLDDEVDTLGGSVLFHVYLDGLLVNTYGPFYHDTAPMNISAYVEGGNELKLEVTDYDNDITCDHADWANATLLKMPQYGLTGEYFNDKTLTNRVLTRTDDAVNFDWGTGSPAAEVYTNSFSVRWSGKIVPDFTEKYTFYTLSDDGMRLWINDKLLIDDWTNHSANPINERSSTITLIAGYRYDIKLEYYDNTGSASALLSWSSNSVSKEVIPLNNFLPK